MKNLVTKHMIYIDDFVIASTIPDEINKRSNAASSNVYQPPQEKSKTTIIGIIIIKILYNKTR